MFNSTLYARTAIAILALSLGACASSPRYVAADDADDYGHYSTQLAENRYRITFNGNERTNLNTTKDYALLRAAQLTLQEGYTWFEVVDRSTVSTQRSQDDPHTGVTHTRHYDVERSCGLLGCSERVRPSTSTAVHIGTGRERTRHSYALEVLMGNGPIPQKGGNYYNADSVAKSLWENI